ncbi:MAG: hypothetical protein R3A48_11305 [Polyangiales bacterium]
MGILHRTFAIIAVTLVAACSDDAAITDAAITDAGTADAAITDAAITDAAITDAGTADAGTADAGTLDVASRDVNDQDRHAVDVVTDTGVTDTGVTDTGVTDTGVTDTGVTDTGVTDAGSSDAASTDTGPTDAGCSNTMTDNNNCGGCGRVCCAGNVCAVGMCVNACPAGQTSCPPATPPVGCFGGGVCRDLRSDAAHCGACGSACPTGQTCVDGACQTPFTALAPCNVPGDYTTGNTVTFGGTLGSAYQPRCLTVRLGESVIFSGNFAGHPLMPSTRGTSNTPITRTAAGVTNTIRFRGVGYFPYFCEFHGTDSGSGMAGVVRVVE